MPLSKEQNEIITATEKNIIAFAGPGTGKSFTILGKIEHLLTVKNVAAEKIFVLTFTRSTAQELKNKIKKDIKITDMFDDN
jgi:superfamily I DNA/RNA helicase